MPVLPLILAGLSLLPKIPAAWGAIAGLFGAKVPESVEQAGALAETILGGVKAGNVSPEAMAAMEVEFNRHKEAMARIALEEKQMEMSGILGAQKVEIASYQSEDEYVKRTRPLILRRMFYLMAGYLMSLPWVMVILRVFNVESSETLLVMQGLKDAFLYICATFSIAYTGYNVVRGQEKKAGCEESPGESSGGILKGFIPGLRK